MLIGSIVLFILGFAIKTHFIQSHTLSAVSGVRDAVETAQNGVVNATGMVNEVRQASEEINRLVDALSNQSIRGLPELLKILVDVRTVTLQNSENIDQLIKQTQLLWDNHSATHHLLIKLIEVLIAEELLPAPAINAVHQVSNPLLPILFPGVGRRLGDGQIVD